MSRAGADFPYLPLKFSESPGIPGLTLASIFDSMFPFGDCFFLLLLYIAPIGSPGSVHSFHRTPRRFWGRSKGATVSKSQADLIDAKAVKAFLQIRSHGALLDAIASGRIPEPILDDRRRRRWQRETIEGLGNFCQSVEFGPAYRVELVAGDARESL